MRRRVPAFVLPLLLFACPQPEPTSATPEPSPEVAPRFARAIFGRVLDHQGAELAGAHLELSRTNSREFRRDEWPMPWIHAHIPPSEHDAFYDAWHFSGIP